MPAVFGFERNFVKCVVDNFTGKMVSQLFFGHQGECWSLFFGTASHFGGVTKVSAGVFFFVLLATLGGITKVSAEVFMYC